MKKGIKIAMGIGIVIVVALFAGFGADYIGNSFRDNCREPSDGYCYSTSVSKPIIENQCYDITTQEECNANNECEWDSYYSYSDECRQSYHNTFSIFSLIIGIIALIAGFIVSKNNEALSGGLVGGGIISLIIAVIGYWSYITELLRVILIGIIAVILIVIAAKKLKD